MPDVHALLSASSSKRWLHCTPSVRLEEGFPNESSVYALEGTFAHSVCEYKLGKYLHKRVTRPQSEEFYTEEIDQITDVYYEFAVGVIEDMKRNGCEPLVLVEERVDYSNIAPSGFGTADLLVLGKDENGCGLLHVIDFKTGKGVYVDCDHNSQMMLYSLGALEIYDSLYDITEVSMTIFQPRRENISTWTIPVNELRDWAENELKPKADLAFKGEGEYCPGDWCTFCRAAVRCRARAEEKLKLAQSEFRFPPLLTDVEIEEVLGKLSDITKWANDLLAYATDAAVNHGKEWSGYKVVAGRSIRKFKDEDAVAEAAKASGYKDIYKQSLITLTEFEKLMGKAKFNEVLGDLVYKPPGKPTLVPVSDKRPAINVSNATNDFNEIMED